MKVTIKKDWYRGTDGSSLSDDRCIQIVILYDLCCRIGEKVITYNELQSIAASEMIFGTTEAGSAIRTFCPILSKLGFINYDGNFKANKMFTEDGLLLIHTLKAIEDAKALERPDVVAELYRTKQKLQRLGLLNMYEDGKYPKHNMWIAIEVLRLNEEIDWDEFGYLVYLVRGNGLKISDALKLIEDNRSKRVTYEYVKEDGKKLANTYYSYIHSFLLEAQIISDYTKGSSFLCDEATEFINMFK